MRHLKLATAVMMLLLCIISVPSYWHRWAHYAAMLAFAVMAYHEYAQGRTRLALAFGVMVIVFQPYLKLTLSMTAWDAIHTALAVILAAMWARETFMSKRQ